MNAIELLKATEAWAKLGAKSNGVKLWSHLDEQAGVFVLSIHQNSVVQGAVIHCESEETTATQTH
jgi:hypothetical protein